MKKFFYCLVFFSIYNSHSQELIWENTHGGVYSEYLFDMLPTFDNGFLLAGSALSSKMGNKNNLNKGNLDYFLWKINHEGKHEWELSYGSDGTDILKNVVKTSDNGYLLGGYSNSGKNGDKIDQNYGKNDIWIVKINAKGVLEWEKSIGSNGNDELVKILQLPKEEYLVIASSNSKSNDFKKSSGFGGVDYWVLKIDKKGDIIWENTYGGIYNDYPTTVLKTNDGFIIGGISNSPISGNKAQDCMGGYDFWIIGIDEKGNLVKQFVFGGTEDESLNEIIYHNKTENYFLLGTTYSSTSNGSLTVEAEKGNDILVVKTDKNFSSLNQFVYDFDTDEFLTSTVMINDNEFLLTGYRQDFENNKKSFLIFKINTNGNKTWQKDISTSGNDVLRKSIQTKDAGIILAGHSTGKNPMYKKVAYGRDDFWIAKLQSEKNKSYNEIELEAYPNPTENWTEVIINHKYKNGELNVYDISGRLLHTETLKYNIIPVDLTSYPTGAYILNVKTDVYNGSIKVIKK